MKEKYTCAYATFVIVNQENGSFSWIVKSLAENGVKVNLEIIEIQELRIKMTCLYKWEIVLSAYALKHFFEDVVSSF